MAREQVSTRKKVCIKAVIRDSKNKKIFLICLLALHSSPKQCLKKKGKNFKQISTVFGLLHLPMVHSPLLIVESLQFAVGIWSFRYKKTYFYHLGFLMYDTDDDGFKFSMAPLDNEGDLGEYQGLSSNPLENRSCRCHRKM